MIESGQKCKRCFATYQQGCIVVDHGLVCSNCSKILDNPKEEKYSDTMCTTIVIGSNGKIWNLGKGEYPGQNDTPVNAYTCLMSAAPGRKKSK